MRQLVSLHQLEWTFDSERIPLSQRIFCSDDAEQAVSSEEQQRETVSVDELESFLRQCIPKVDVQLKVCYL